MELKNIFKMTKTDRYTQDGRDEIAKLQETEDVTYKTGDISQKTGLQKQPDGSWAPPKKGGQSAAENKSAAESIPIQGEDWIALPSGTRMTIAGAREKYTKNKERIESLKKLMEGNTKAGNFRIGAELKRLENENEYLDEMLPPESKPAGKPETEPKHTLEVGSEVKFKKSGQPITIKKIENYGGTPIVVGEYDYNGKRETNRFRLDELDYEQKEERKDLVSGNTLEEGRTVNFKKTGQPIKIKKVEYYGSTPIIVGEYEHNGKTETNRFRMDEIETPDSAPRELTGDCKIRIRK